MLTNEDLQSIGEMMDTKIQANNQTLSEMMDAKIQANNQTLSEMMDAKIQTSQSQLRAEIKTSQSQLRAEIKTSQSQILAYIESAVIPKFNLLADGQKNLLETLAPKNRVEALEEDVSLLKSIIQLQNGKIAELEKKIG